MRRIAALAVGVLVLSGCGASPAHPQAKVQRTLPVRTVEKVGPFTVREISLAPSLVVQGFPRYGPYALAGTGTLVRVSTQAPYTLFRRGIGQTGWQSVGTVQCAAQPFFAQSLGPDAWLYCAGAAGAGESTLVRVAGTGPLQSLPISVNVPKSVTPIVAYAEEFDGPHGGLVWSVSANAEPPTLYGRGYIDLLSGHSGALPVALSALQYYNPTASTFLGVDDTLYETRISAPLATSMAIYRWLPRNGGWTLTGRVHREPYAYGGVQMAADGSLWSVIPLDPSTSPVPTRWRVERVVSGEARVVSWQIRGDLVGLGPGYVAYLPFSDPTALVIDFPTVHRSISYPNLYSYPGPPYMLNDVAVMDDGGSTLTGAQVITIGTAHSVKDLLITP